MGINMPVQSLMLTKQTYPHTVVSGASDRLINMYFEPLPEGAVYPSLLTQRSGLKKAFDTEILDGCRGSIQFEDNVYIVLGENLVKLTFGESVLTSEIVGTLSNNNQPVYIETNSLQIAILTTDGDYYVYDGATLTQIPLPFIPSSMTFGAQSVILSEKGTFAFYISDVGDATTFNLTLKTGAAESPYKIVRMFYFHQELWALKEDAIEIFAPNADAALPFILIQGTPRLSIGLANPLAITSNGDILAWLGSDAIIYGAVQHAAQKISTYAIESQIAKSDLKNVTAYSFTEKGHKFIIFNFPDLGTSFCYDAKENLWHERQTLFNGVTSSWQGVCPILFQNKPYFFDKSLGLVYKLDQETYGDNDKEFQRIVHLPYVNQNEFYIFHNYLEIRCDKGVGGFNNPAVILQYSTDQGHTWSTERALSLGGAGQYNNSLKTYGLGANKGGRIYRLIFTDFYKWVITGISLDYEVGTGS